MKLLLKLLFVFVISAPCLAQNSIIVTKTGERIKVVDETLEIVIQGRRVAYTLPGKTWAKFIKFEDLDYVQMGNSILFKSFKLSTERRYSGYFVNAEKGDKRLISLVVTITSSGRIHSSTTNYYIRIVDQNDTVLDSLTVPESGSEKNKLALLTLIKKHFGDCPDVLEKYSNIEDALKNLGANPLINCN